MTKRIGGKETESNTLTEETPKREVAQRKRRRANMVSKTNQRLVNKF